MCPTKTSSILVNHGCNPWSSTFLSFPTFLCLIPRLTQKGTSWHWQRGNKSFFPDQRQVGLVCWLALALCIAFPTLLLHKVSHLCEVQGFSHFISMDNHPKPASSFHLLCSNTKLWTVQRLSGLPWEHTPKLQRGKFILKSTFTYMWVTMVLKLLQGNIAVS